MEGKTKLKGVIAWVLIQEWEACVQHLTSFIHCRFQLRDSRLESLYFLHMICSCGLKPELYTGYSCDTAFLWNAFLVLQSCCAVLMMLYYAGRAVACAASVTWLLPHVHEPSSQSKAIVELHSPSVSGESPALLLKSGKVFLSQLLSLSHKDSWGPHWAGALHGPNQNRKGQCQTSSATLSMWLAAGYKEYLKFI